MKENWFMQVNKGFTLIEVLISITIFGLITIGVFSLNHYYRVNNLNNQNKLSEELVLHNVYEIFSEEPQSFKDNIYKMYRGTWNNELFSFDESLKINIQLRYLILKCSIKLEIIKGGEVIEHWERIRV